MSYNDLNESSPMIFQPNNLITELMQHQKTAVYAMKDLEEKCYIDIKYRYYDNDEKDLRIDTSIGILGDKVGSGKTLIITALLLESYIPKQRPIYFTSDKYITICEPDNSTSNLNIIMVPKGIQHQWADVFDHSIKKGKFNYMNHFDSSTYDNMIKYVNNSIKYVNNSIEKNIQTNILCNEHSITDIIKNYSEIKWNRFIIDEADTINFSYMNKIKFSFIWLITGTTNGIAYSKKKYIKDIFGKNITWLPDFLLVKNNNTYIEKSIQLPKPNRITINCFTPCEITLLAEHIPKNIMNMINAGNSDEAIKALNCHEDTTDNIFKVISRNYEMAIKNKQLELDAEINKKYSSAEKSSEQQKKIQRIQHVIDHIKIKLNSMKKSLYDANDDICPICMDDFDKPTFVDCCSHKYCFNCLALTLEKTFNKCPICQTKLTKNKMHVVASSNKELNKDINKDINKNINKFEKLEVLYDIISKNKKGKYLVFADYDVTFTKIEKVLKLHKVKYGILKGGGGAIKNTLDDFQKGKINVIMLNAKHFGAGVNLQCATDIILYHRFSKEIEEQIIGRGQRMGRNDTLNIYYLIHDNESNSYSDDNFTDLNYQEWIENNS
jgi:hypothetical protein